VEYSFHLPGSAEEFTAEGVIVWSRRIDEEWCVGINFSTMPETTQEAIRDFLKKMGC